jgi:leader peptidase (prepilin peptidase)/N-methyltransferase
MPLMLVELILSAVVGLLVGSFLATLVLRLPEKRPVIVDRSACPKCGHRLGALELIPVVSWLAQGRRCRACGAQISGFYPLMEIASALVAVAAIWSVPWPAAALACFGGWVLLTAVAMAVQKRLVS